MSDSLGVNWAVLCVWQKWYKMQPHTFCYSLHTKHFCFPSELESPQTARTNRARRSGRQRWNARVEPASGRNAPSLQLAQAIAQIHVIASMTGRLNILIVKASARYPHWAFATANARVPISLTQTLAVTHIHMKSVSLLTSLSMLTAGVQRTAGTKPKDWRKIGTGLQLNAWVLPTWTDKQCPKVGIQALVPTHYNNSNRRQ